MNPVGVEANQSNADALSVMQMIVVWRPIILGLLEVKIRLSGIYGHSRILPFSFNKSSRIFARDMNEIPPPTNPHDGGDVVQMRPGSFRPVCDDFLSEN
jgi:hypothetical protein